MSCIDLHSRLSTWYRVKFLGEGGFGIVSLAEHTNGNTYAVKTARLDDSNSLIKENKILKYFHNCPEIVQFYGDEIAIENGVRFYNLFLEYAPDGDLFDLIYRAGGGPISHESNVRKYTRMILKGLSCIHAKGIVHCDIKPENILVFPFEDGYRLKITDFGSAKEPNEVALQEKQFSATKKKIWSQKKIFRDQNLDNEMCRFRGTANFMSPESVIRGEIETALDIWSLGLVVLWMITGKQPWQGVDGVGKVLDLETIYLLLASTELMPHIPQDMSEIGKDFLRNCLQRDPRKRWSAQKLLDHPYVC